MRPGDVLDIEHREAGIVFPDGRRYQDVTVTLSEEAKERVRTGYQCGNCLEVFSEAWPKECRVCGFAVARDQADFFVQQFLGQYDMVGGITMDMIKQGEEDLARRLREGRR